MGTQQFSAQRVEPVAAAGGQGKVAAHGGEPPGHPLAEAGAGAGDQDPLADGVRHRDSMPKPVTAPLQGPAASLRVAGAAGSFVSGR